MGSIYRRGRVWWLKWYLQGHCIRESSKSESEKEARRLLKIREGDAARGKGLINVGRLKFSALLNDLMIDYQLNNRKSIKTVFYMIDSHVLPFFGDLNVADIKGSLIQRYAYLRKQQSVSNSAVNNELAIVSRAFTLGIENGRIEVMPKVKKLKPDPPRQDFYTSDEIGRLIDGMPDYLMAISLFACWTGWRLSEILRLRWSEVDFESNEIRIKPGESKSGQVRVIVMTPELRALMEKQSTVTRHTQHPLCLFVFNRNGSQIRNIRTAWDNARERAKLTDHTFHGFRRTLRRRLDERGISEKVGMAIMGHKTRKIFDDYRVVSRADLVDAANKLSDESGTISGTDALDKKGTKE